MATATLSGLPLRLPSRSTRIITSDGGGGNLSLTGLFNLIQLTDFLVTAGADIGAVPTWNGSTFNLMLPPSGGGGGGGGAVPRFRIGIAAPSDALGTDGDLYINASTSDVYGPKASGIWGGISANIRGLQGPQGIAGAAGAAGAPGTPGTVMRAAAGVPSNILGINGDFYINTTNGDFYTKASGSYTVTLNIKGPQGATGIQGATGAAGAPGSQILVGTAAPLSSQGNNGDLFVNTTTGQLYTKASGAWTPNGAITGPQGVQGPTGTAGAAFLSGVGVPSSGTGNNGDTYLNTSNGDVYRKISGSWGAPTGNLKGPTGTVPSLAAKNLYGNATSSVASAGPIPLASTLDFIGGALGIKPGATIPLDASSTRTISWDATTGNTFINTPTGPGVVQIDDDGNLYANSLNDNNAIFASLGGEGQWITSRGPNSAPAWYEPPFIDANNPQFRTVGGGVADDRLSLQSALDSVPDEGGVVQFSGLYAISGPLLIKSKTTAIFWGSSFIPHPSWPVPSSSDPLVTPGYCFLTNRNYLASAVTDQDIYIIGFMCDWKTLTDVRGPQNGAHGIRLRRVLGGVVEHSVIRGGGVGTSLYGCTGGLVTFCALINQTLHNAAIYEGSNNCGITNSRIVMSNSSGANGIYFTATDSRSGVGFSGVKLNAVNNSITGPTGASANAVGSAIKFDAGAGCTLIAGSANINLIDGQGAMTNGINVTANGTSSRIVLGQNRTLGISRTTGKDILATMNDSQVLFNPTDASSLTAALSVTGSRNTVWSIDPATGDTVCAGAIRASNVT